MDRDSGRGTEKQAERSIGMGRGTERKVGGQKSRQRHRQAGKQRGGKMGRWTERQAE